MQKDDIAVSPGSPVELGAKWWRRWYRGEDRSATKLKYQVSPVLGMHILRTEYVRKASAILPCAHWHQARIQLHLVALLVIYLQRSAYKRRGPFEPYRIGFCPPAEILDACNAE